MKRKLITNHLFEDIFRKFKTFFACNTIKDNKFLYDISYGFMPRHFHPDIDSDKIIYDYEDEVPEMYFGLSG